MKKPQPRHPQKNIPSNSLAMRLNNPFALKKEPLITHYLDQANQLMAKNDLVAAEQSIDMYLKSQPNCLTGLNAKAVLAARQYRLDEAEKIWREITVLNPQNHSTFSNLGNLFRIAKRYDEAIQALQQAIVLKPDDADVHLNLGVIYGEMGNHTDALKSYDLAITYNPNDPQAYFNKAHLMQDLFQHSTAFALYRQALRCNPNHYGANANLILTQHYVMPFVASDARDEAIRFGRTIVSGVKQFKTWQVTPDKHRPLKIGFVSGDFRGHPVGFFLEPVLRALDLNAFKLYAYSSFITEDDLTQRIKPFFCKWSMVESFGDDSLAQLIHDDQIDILIDLAGHSAFNRLAAFARKPAPIQVAWLGYFATTGLAEMDYVLADAVCVPIEEDSLFTETVWRLPQSRLVLFQPTETTAVSELPCLHQPFTFGCFQELAKINDHVLAAWSAILAACPHARLRLQNSKLNRETNQAALKARMLAHNINFEQVDLFGSMPRVDYLKAYAQVDVLLDTFPYPGGTTTVEALWMGVPTITLINSWMLGRQGAGLLAAVGLDDWICDTQAAYIAKAIEWATGNPEIKNRLATLRINLPQMCANSPAADPQAFARVFEAALRDMWSIWCDQAE